jgi:hypothetical protein
MDFIGKTMSKLYVYFLKRDNSLYAWTYDKITCSNFESQRCMDVFNKSIIKADDDNISIIAGLNSNRQITHDVLFDGNDDIIIYCTIKESDLLSLKIDELYSLLSNMNLLSDKYPLQEKYCDLIFKITNIINDGPGKYALDTYRIFYDMNRYTLTGSELKT